MRNEQINNKDIELIYDYPPMYQDILDYGMKPNPNTIYTYGKIIYFPFGGEENSTLPQDIVEHEKIHMIQQENDPDLWWGRYLVDKYFRLSQEVEAYAAQYQYLCKYQNNKEKQNKIALNLAGILAGPVYGDLIAKNYAVQLVKEFDYDKPFKKCPCGNLLPRKKQKFCSDACSRIYRNVKK